MLHNPVQHLIFHHDIAVHQQDIIVQKIPRTVNTVDIIRLPVFRILHKSDIQRQIQGIALIHQNPIIIAGSNHHIPDPGFGKLVELAGQNRFPG